MPSDLASWSTEHSGTNTKCLAMASVDCSRHYSLALSRESVSSHILCLVVGGSPPSMNRTSHDAYCRVKHLVYSNS